MNILLVNCHTAYAFMLAHTGHQILVLQAPNTHAAWDIRNRPLPSNVKILNDSRSIVQLLSEGNGKLIDRCIIQDTFVGHENPREIDLRDRQMFDGLKCPKVALFHNSFQTHFRNIPMQYWHLYKQSLAEKLKGIKCVFISKMKKESYAPLDGEIILPGIDEAEFGGWSGQYNIGLTCLNNAYGRDFMNGTIKTQMVMQGLKWTLIGQEGDRNNVPGDFEQFKQALRAHRYYVCLNNPQFEDGYNLSMLEFMLTGGPGVTLDHPSSPVIDGVNGIRAKDANELNKRLHELTYEDCIQYGRKARETVIEKFPMEDFIDNWNAVLDMP